MRSAGVVAVDVFCGAGGLTRGLLDAGIKVRAGYDIDGAARYAYETNNHVSFHEIDVRKLRSPVVKRALTGGGSTLIAGCAPCQPFSLLGRTACSMDDSRSHLLREFSRLVYGVVPTYVTMENVPGLRHTPAFDNLLKVLRMRGYFFDYAVVDAAFYGVPQHRRRLVLVASRKGPIRVPAGSVRAPMTVREAIGGLRVIRSGGIDPGDPIHRSAKLTPLNLRRIRASRPGTTWQRWPPKLRLNCHLRSTGREYVHTYGRMSWDSAAPTITASFFNLGSGRFGHPAEDRALSLREGALLQTFPQSYRFTRKTESMPVRHIGQLIGNAVPVALARTIGEAIMDHERSG